MVVTKSYKLLLIAFFSLGIVNSSQIKASNNIPIYVGSLVIGVTHGIFKKTSEYLDFRAKKDSNFKKDRTFEFITFISAHMIRLQLLGNKDIVDLNTKNIASAWWHGFGQALVESYDVTKGSFITTPANLTLILAILGFGGFVVANGTH